MYPAHLPGPGRCYGQILLCLVLPLLQLLLLSGCERWDDPAAAREARADKSREAIVVGAVWPWQGQKGSLWQGIELASEEINLHGGLLGLPLRIVREDDESSLARGRLIAQQFVEDKEMVAVIGHLNSYIALPAAAMYQAGGLVYLTPGASDDQINRQGFDHVFRTLPSNRSLGRRLAELAAARGYRRLAIAYVKDRTSRGMANHFEQRARELGLSIVDRRAYTVAAEEFTQLAHLWKDLYRFDAIFLAGNMPTGGHLIEALRTAGLNEPIIGGDGLDTPGLLRLAAAEGVLLPQLYDPQSASAYSARFTTRYRARYDQSPDTYAALGYDTVMLLAQAIERANSARPSAIARALQATRGWQGVTGEFSFDEYGDTPERRIGYKEIRQGQFVSLSAQP